MKKSAKVIVGILAILFSGYCFPFFLFPKTGAHGWVVDQYNNPVSNVVMQASWVPASLWFVMMPAVRQQNFHSNGEGYWSFCRRNAEDLEIEALPPSGYEPVWRPNERKDTIVGLFKNGECPTNDYILRMIKIEPPSQPKDPK
jgi:hypothetical protein